MQICYCVLSVFVVMADLLCVFSVIHVVTVENRLFEQRLKKRVRELGKLTATDYVILFLLLMMIIVIMV